MEINLKSTPMMVSSLGLRISRLHLFLTGLVVGSVPLASRTTYCINKDVIAIAKGNSQRFGIQYWLKLFGLLNYDLKVQ